MKPKLIIVELWGIGDLIIATPFLKAASDKFEVTLLAKPYAKDLQQRFWPGVTVESFVAPWTAFQHKYQLYRWPWPEMLRLRQQLRGRRFDHGLSARWDPRDHFLLAAARVRHRIGFPRAGSQLFLTRSLQRPGDRTHRYDYWRALADALNLSIPERRHIISPLKRKGFVLLHSGAAQHVRVWPLTRFHKVVVRLRELGVRVQIACDADQRQWWLQVGEAEVVTPGTVSELIHVIDGAAVFIGNDSGPGHLAAFSGIPTYTIFGPQLPELFAPLHPNSEWSDGAPCPHKPCSDYCRFPVPTCLYDLKEENVLPRIEEFVMRNMDQLARETHVLKTNTPVTSAPSNVESSSFQTRRNPLQRQYNAAEDPGIKSATLSVSVSLADQRFDQVKSLGILGTSLGIARALASSSEVQRLTLLGNPSLPAIQAALGGPLVETKSVGNRRGKLWRLWWDQFGAYSAAAKSSNEWLLLPKGYASFLRSCPVKLATYVHDVGPEYYRQRYPRGYPPLEVTYFHAGLRAAIMQSSVILANTDFTAGEIRSIAQQLGLKCPPVQVVGIGFERPAPSAQQLRTRVVTLANRWPHKRTDLAIEFLSEWQRKSGFEGPVDWVGSLPDHLPFPEFSNWRIHSRLPQPEFDRLLQQARVFVYVSDYEGFGMPPVETALAGACPVYSDLPSTREVMGGVGFPFSNGNFESFASAMRRAIETPSTQIGDWATSLLERHNWKAVQERTIRALRVA